MSELKPIAAPRGMVLTNGATFSEKIYLGCNDREENWWLITDAEAEKIQAEMWPEEEFTYG